MNGNRRIALGAIIIECNHLGGKPADMNHFRRHELRFGTAVLAQSSGVIGGVLSVLRARGTEIVPLVVASACPSGPLTSACYEELKTELLNRLSSSLPVAGILLPLHGAAASEDIGDLEGDLLTAVRNVLGPQVPVVVTLDHHAHVTEAMVHCADAIVAWDTYPHRDTYETGIRGAKMLLDILDGRIRPAMAMAKVPVMVSAIHGNTEGEGPFADVMRLAKSFEAETGVLSTSAFLVHPYLDVANLGSGGLVVTDDDLDKAQALACKIANAYWGRRFELEPPLWSPADAIARGMEVDGPVLLIDTADCCGGGAAGDSVAVLKALLNANIKQLSFVPVVDPEAAAVCHRLGVGQEVTLDLGHKLDPKWGKPVSVDGVVVSLHDRRFRYTGGIFSGQEASMGPSAVLQVGAIRVLVTSQPTYDWADEQFCCVGMNPSDAKFIVVKNPMNYRLAYAGIAKAALVLDTPGPTPATMRNYQYQNLRRPYYPADRGLCEIAPLVYSRTFAQPACAAGIRK